MSDKSKIEWCDATWNPVRGCVKVSPGCKLCYASTFAERWRGVPGHPYEQGFDLRLVPEKLQEPLKWKKPRRIFVNSMSDLFQDGVPFEFVDRIFATMFESQWHTFQVLTKRPDRMASYLSDKCARLNAIGAQAYYAYSQRCPDRAKYITNGECVDELFRMWPFPNVWLGCSVENQKYADERREHLRACPAAVRFVSYEPALGPVDWHGWDFIDQLIIGGESGPGARPFNSFWAMQAVAWCRRNKIAAFVKQFGSKPHLQYDGDVAKLIYPNGVPDGVEVSGYAVYYSDIVLKDKKGGDPAEWGPGDWPREFPVAREVATT